MPVERAATSAAWRARARRSRPTTATRFPPLGRVRALHVPLPLTARIIFIRHSCVRRPTTHAAIWPPPPPPPKSVIFIRRQLFCFYTVSGLRLSPVPVSHRSPSPFCAVPRPRPPPSPQDTQAPRHRIFVVTCRTGKSCRPPLFLALLPRDPFIAKPSPLVLFRVRGERPAHLNEAVFSPREPPVKLPSRPCSNSNRTRVREHGRYRYRRPAASCRCENNRVIILLKRKIMPYTLVSSETPAIRVSRLSSERRITATVVTRYVLTVFTENYRVSRFFVRRQTTTVVIVVIRYRLTSRARD